MKSTRSVLAVVTATVAFLGLAAGATAQLEERYTGTLMPVKCQNDDREDHTAACALKCAESGLGLVTEKGDFLKFDAKGDEKALAWLKATTREKDLKVIVTGAMKDGQLQITSIDDPK